ncbi:hypothetical protein BFP97_05995 [Roseivirga sp. 4D4]|uniref:hypothetical protein n=1 Tax=Roseivirga sp. 4D4 TaxID=1889784 RepID=UPI0008529BA0|nr:hypothetical protein [Roseivirga sp. 4D4]OEK01084.1 hypothetical protein BFP97_05995 [Roseivirga sp. 4D4]
MKKFSIILLAISLVALNSKSNAQTNDSKLLPSEALVLMYNAVDLNPDKKRIENTKPYQSRVITEGLQGDEIFYLGETYFWNFMPKEAAEAYSQFLEEDSPRGRASWQRYLQIQFRAFDKHDFVEEKLSEYRKKFKPTPDDRYGIYGQVINVANLYLERGEHEKVLELINEELAYINYGGAYNSLLLPAYFHASYRSLGKVDEAVTALKKAKAGLMETLDKRKQKKTSNEEFQYVAHSRPVASMETIMTSKLSHTQMNDKFEALIQSISRALELYGG